MIDIGLNLSSPRFDNDRKKVIQRAIDAGLTHLFLTGSDIESNTHSIKLADSINIEYPQLSCYSTVGIHPHHADQVNDDYCQIMKQLLQHSSVVAVGETGLDFFRNLQPQTTQINAFEQHLALAAELQMPVFLHQRDAHWVFYDILKKWVDRIPKMVVHCFTDTQQALHDYLDLGCYIGITGWVCDERRGIDLQASVKHIPLDRLLIETDAPYLLPRTIKPKPSNNRNEPANLIWVVKQLAISMGVTEQEIIQHSTHNAINFFLD